MNVGILALGTIPSSGSSKLGRYTANGIQRAAAYCTMTKSVGGANKYKISGWEETPDKLTKSFEFDSF